MKVERDVLEKKILLAIDEVISSKEFDNKALENIKNKLYSRNIFNASQLLGGNIPLNTVERHILYALSEAIYEETDLYFINPEIYFLDNEIEIYKTFKVDVSKSKNLIEFNNMIQINESHWIGKISVKYLAELYNNLKITYNPQTQRESGYFEDNGRLIFVPKQNLEECWG